MNDDIRAQIRICGFKQYEICEVLGVSESTFIRWLRSPLADAKRSKIEAAIDQLAEERDLSDFLKERAKTLR